MKLKNKIFILVLYTVFLTGFTSVVTPNPMHTINPPIQIVSPTPLIDMVLDIELVNIEFTEEKYHEFITYGELGMTAYEFLDIVYLVYQEARGESSQGQEMVVYNILSRVIHGEFPDTIQGVIWDSGAYCGTEVDTWGEYNDEVVENVIRALRLWNSYELDERYRVMTFFNNPQYVSGNYADRYGLKLIEEVGGHRFYGYRDDL
jgi:hypothetical protein